SPPPPPPGRRDWGAPAAAVPLAGPAASTPRSRRRAAGLFTQPSGPHLTGSALTGDLLLVLADLAVQQTPIFEGLPAGVLTAGSGGIFLGYPRLNFFKKGQSRPHLPLDWPLLNSVSVTWPNRYCP